MKRRKPARMKKASPAPRADENLDASNRALLALEEARSADVPALETESVEDVLHDWPESADDTDQWLNERPGRDQQREG